MLSGKQRGNCAGILFVSLVPSKARFILVISIQKRLRAESTSGSQFALRSIPHTQHGKDAADSLVGIRHGSRSGIASACSNIVAAPQSNSSSQKSCAEKLQFASASVIANCRGSETSRCTGTAANVSDDRLQIPSINPDTIASLR